MCILYINITEFIICIHMLYTNFNKLLSIHYIISIYKVKKDNFNNYHNICEDDNVNYILLQYIIISINIYINDSK